MKTVHGQPGSVSSPAGLPSGRAAPLTFRQRGAMWIRRHRVAPYLLLLPSLAMIAALVLWPTIQIGIFSFQNYGLPQLVGTEPTQWIGLSNYCSRSRSWPSSCSSSAACPQVWSPGR